MNLKWYKFLLTENRNFVIKNLEKIYHSLDDVSSRNATAEVLDKLHPQNLLDFINKNNLSNIFKNYEIDEFLGSGAMGMAFSLKDPHENYVFKIEMHLSKPGSDKKRPGADYVSSLYNKQQSGERESGEINILESVKIQEIGRAHV